MRRPIPFGRFLMLDRIAVGGMAEVFAAKTFGVEGFERLLAIKRILPNMVEDEEFITMFIDEARIAAQLSHANIVQINELGKHDDTYYIAMEYVSGRDVRSLIDKFRRRKEPLPVGMAVFIAARIAEGLDYAHAKTDGFGNPLGIIHRDISPHNVLVSYDGEVKIIDFGIAKAEGRIQKTQAGILKGKFSYMSPEQVRGLEIDHRSDIFSAGVMLYEMLTGTKPFRGENDLSTIELVRAGDVRPPSELNPEIPPALEAVMLKALASERDERYRNAGDLHDDLLRFLFSGFSGDQIYSTRRLASFMRNAFKEELTRETERIQRWWSASPQDVWEPEDGSQRPRQKVRIGGDAEEAGAPEADERTTVLRVDQSNGQSPQSLHTDTPVHTETPLRANTTDDGDDGATQIKPLSDLQEGTAIFGTGELRTPPPHVATGSAISTAGRDPAWHTGSSASDEALTAPPLLPQTRPQQGRLAMASVALVAVLALALVSCPELRYAMGIEQRPPSNGLVVLDVLPQSARVEVDGQAVRLPYAEFLAAGEHTIRASAPSHDPIEQVFDVRVGERRTVALRLRHRGEAKAGDTPDAGEGNENADAGDGVDRQRPVSFSPPIVEKRAPSPPPSRIDAPQRAPAPAANETGSAVAGRTQASDRPVPAIAPVAAPARVGSLAVFSDPRGARVSVDGVDRGATPAVVEDLPEGGTVEVRITLDGYEPQTRNVRIGSSGRERLSVKLSAAALLEVETTPVTPSSHPPADREATAREVTIDAAAEREGVAKVIALCRPAAKVLVDGKDTGRWTPIPPKNPIELPPGRHVLTCEAADGAQKSQEVVLEAGEIFRFNVSID